MIMIDTLRTLVGIRKERLLPPPGERPLTGSHIVHDGLRIHLKMPITTEQWLWLAEKGWRKIDMRTNRRHYGKVDDKLVHKLLMTDDINLRDEIYLRILDTKQRPKATSA